MFFDEVPDQFLALRSYLLKLDSVSFAGDPNHRAKCFDNRVGMRESECQLHVGLFPQLRRIHLNSTLTDVPSYTAEGTGIRDASHLGPNGHAQMFALILQYPSDKGD